MKQNIIIIGLVCISIGGCFVRPGWGQSERDLHEIRDLIHLYLELGPVDIDINEDNFADKVSIRLLENGYNFQGRRIRDFYKRDGLYLDDHKLVPTIEDASLVVRYPGGFLLYPHRLPKNNELP